MTKESGTGSPEGGRRVDPRPRFHYLAEDAEDEQASGGLNRLASRLEELSGRGREPDAEEHVPQNSTEETERAKNGKGFRGPGGEHINNYEQQGMSVRTLEGLVRWSTWRVADVRIPPVSACHHEQEDEGEIRAQKGRQRVRARFNCSRRFMQSIKL